MNKDKIIIKKGSGEVTFDRCEIGTVTETSDGIIFMLRNGLLIQYVDNFMDPPIKSKIKNTVDKIPNGTITINLNDYRNPVSIDATLSLK